MSFSHLSILVLPKAASVWPRKNSTVKREKILRVPIRVLRSDFDCKSIQFCAGLISVGFRQASGGGGKNAQKSCRPEGRPKTVSPSDSMMDVTTEEGQRLCLAPPMKTLTKFKAEISSAV